MKMYFLKVKGRIQRGFYSVVRFFIVLAVVLKLFLFNLTIHGAERGLSDGATEHATQEAIHIFDAKELKDAHLLWTLISELPPRLVLCLDSNPDELGECGCLDGSSCEYKQALVGVVDAYCSVIKTYPHWAGVSPFYLIGADLNDYEFGDKAVGYALDMRTAEKRLGKGCVGF